MVIYARRNGPPRSLTSLDDARAARSIGVYIGDAREAALRRRGFTNLVVAPSPENLWKMPESDRIELLAGTNLIVNNALGDSGLTTLNVMPVLTFNTVDLYLAFSPETDPALVARWQTALERIRQDGREKAVLERWFSLSPEE